VRVEVDPEFAAHGGEAPQRMPQHLSRIGAVLRLTAPGADPWDLAIGEPEWWRTPIAGTIAFVSEWTAFVVDVAGRRALHELPAARIREDERHALLLISDEAELTAIGADGIAWRTGPVATDDLKVVAIDADRIVCVGYVGGGRPIEIVIDAGDGSVLR
jgi:hypothetical protein